MAQEPKTGFPAAFLAGVAVMLLLLGGVFLLTRHTGVSRSPSKPHLPMTATERAYASQIRFSNLQMSRASNFLNQEVTFLFGAVANDGARAVREVEVTVEFHDIFNQVVLRDPRRVLGPRAAPLAAGQRREFQFGFEHVPADWNRQVPSLRITGLLLE